MMTHFVEYIYSKIIMLKYHIVNISLLARYQACEGFQLCAADADGEHACGCVCELLVGSGSAGTRMG